jgi:hypothetical protein
VTHEVSPYHLGNPEHQRRVLLLLLEQLEASQTPSSKEDERRADLVVQLLGVCEVKCPDTSSVPHRTLQSLTSSFSTLSVSQTSSEQTGEGRDVVIGGVFQTTVGGNSMRPYKVTHTEVFKSFVERESADGSLENVFGGRVGLGVTPPRMAPTSRVPSPDLRIGIGLAPTTKRTVIPKDMSVVTSIVGRVAGHMVGRR